MKNLTKWSTTHYWLESKDKDDKVLIIGHSKNKETGEIYYKHPTAAYATKLMYEEKKVSPEYQYRVVKETLTKEVTDWS